MLAAFTLDLLRKDSPGARPAAAVLGREIEIESGRWLGSHGSVSAQTAGHIALYHPKEGLLCDP